MLESLDDLGKRFSVTSTDRRRNLRSDIEKRSLAINADFLAAFREVKNTVDGIRSQVLSMNDSVDLMKDRLSKTQKETSALIQQTNSLQNDCQKLEFQRSVARAFNQRFQLSPEEHVSLYGEKNARSTNVTAEFFAALDRIQRIHLECRQLMQQLPVASDIMEEMTLHQEGAFERLYRWTQSQCRSLDTANEATTNLVLEAMRRLQERPVLFKYVLDEYATTRRAILVRNFIDALTRGPKPIEEHSSDHQRYVGDMLAWLHQAIPTERDALHHLVQQCNKEECQAGIQETLASICEGVCHPLKVRIEMVLNARATGNQMDSDRHIFVLYAVANLIRFYEGVLNEVVHGGQLQECLRDLQTASEQAYLSALAGQIRTFLAGGLEPPNNELVPSRSVLRSMDLLKEILGVANMTTSSVRQSDIAKIVSTVLDPLLQAVTESASHLPTSDVAVYLLNSIYTMQSTLAMFEYVDERMERLQGQCEAQVDTLTSQQATSLVTNLNLSPIYTILQTPTKVDKGSLKQFADKFVAFLEMPERLLLPQVMMLQSINHRVQVQKRSFQVVATIYQQLWDKLNADAENEGERAEKLLRHKPDYVAKLLVKEQDC